MSRHRGDDRPPRAAPGPHHVTGPSRGPGVKASSSPATGGRSALAARLDRTKRQGALEPGGKAERPDSRQARRRPHEPDPGKSGEERPPRRHLLDHGLGVDRGHSPAARRLATGNAARGTAQGRLPGPTSRAPGPWAVAHAPAARWTDCDERARADVEQRDQTRAPRNRDPREAEAGPLVESCPRSARAAATAHADEAGHHGRHRRRGHARLPDLGG